MSNTTGARFCMEPGLKLEIDVSLDSREQNTTGISLFNLPFDRFPSVTSVRDASQDAAAAF